MGLSMDAPHIDSSFEPRLKGLQKVGDGFYGTLGLGVLLPQQYSKPQDARWRPGGKRMAEGTARATNALFVWTP